MQLILYLQEEASDITRDRVYIPFKVGFCYPRKHGLGECVDVGGGKQGPTAHFCPGAPQGVNLALTELSEHGGIATVKMDRTKSRKTSGQMITLTHMAHNYGSSTADQS